MLGENPPRQKKRKKKKVTLKRIKNVCSLRKLNFKNQKGAVILLSVSLSFGPDGVN